MLQGLEEAAIIGWFSSDGERFAAPSPGAAARVWDVPGGDVVAGELIPERADRPRFSADGSTWVVTAGEEAHLLEAAPDLNLRAEDAAEDSFAVALRLRRSLSPIGLAKRPVASGVANQTGPVRRGSRSRPTPRLRRRRF